VLKPECVEHGVALRALMAEGQDGRSQSYLEVAHKATPCCRRHGESDVKRRRRSGSVTRSKQGAVYSYKLGGLEDVGITDKGQHVR